MTRGEALGRAEPDALGYRWAARRTEHRQYLAWRDPDGQGGCQVRAVGGVGARRSCAPPRYGWEPLPPVVRILGDPPEVK